jgi:ABC-type proline/glycine betaine transport system ATPase subunit
VLSVSAVMTPRDDRVACVGSVPVDWKIEALAARVFEQDEPLAVTDKEGKVIGQVSSDAVLDILINKRTPK